MKRTILLLLIAILTMGICLIGCTTENEKETANWIKTAKKPVHCLFVGEGEHGRKYTLIDAEGNIYSTGYVYMALPDTIRVVIIEEIYK